MCAASLASMSAETAATRWPIRRKKLLDGALLALKDFAFVGITETMQDSVACLGDYLKIDLAQGQAALNAGADNAGTAPGIFRTIKRTELTPAHTRALSKLTRLDDTVYQAALRL